MESYFLPFRQGVIGIDEEIPSLRGGNNRLIYADWTASGRNYGPIEKEFRMKSCLWWPTPTRNLHHRHGHDLCLPQGSTDHQNTRQCPRGRCDHHGWIWHDSPDQQISTNVGAEIVQDFFLSGKAVVFITHMEHHSNHTSWIETQAEVVIIPPDSQGLVDLNQFESLLKQYQDRPLKIASITACSNVTGIITPYHEIAKMIHAAGGWCFVDFACSAPYIKIDMHPEEEGAELDAIFFSPHKFLGGPGSAGVLIFSKRIYNNAVPDHPGGGTVSWTNPWGNHQYIEDIATREDGGTPAFLQTIKTTMCISLKEEMGISNIMEREHQLLDLLWQKVAHHPKVHLLAPNHKNRLAILSFYIQDLHYNLGVKMLNDIFGIQCRGGCSCAGTYGHYLLNLDPTRSDEIFNLINRGDYSLKPGWIRISLHPTLTNREVNFIGESILELAEKHQEWSKYYSFDPSCNKLELYNTGSKSAVFTRMDRALTAGFLPDPMFELGKA